MIGFLKDHIVRFLHTKDGAKAALICVKYANTKVTEGEGRGVKGEGRRERGEGMERG
jgi:hypothetical protein